MMLDSKLFLAELRNQMVTSLPRSTDLIDQEISGIMTVLECCIIRSLQKMRGNDNAPVSKVYNTDRG